MPVVGRGKTVMSLTPESSAISMMGAHPVILIWIRRSWVVLTDAKPIHLGVERKQESPQIPPDFAYPSSSKWKAGWKAC